MKKKIVWILLIVFLVLIGTLLAVPFLFKGKIMEAIKTEANKSLNAELAFSDVSLSLIRSFPNLSIAIYDLSIANNAPFEGDTLISAAEIAATVNLLSVINGEQIKIKSILLDEARIHALVMKDGKANWDISKAAPAAETAQAEEPAKFNIALSKYEIRNSLLVYEDKSMDFYTRIEQLNHTGKGDFTQDVFLLRTNTSIQSFNLSFGGIKYLSRVNTEMKVDLDMDMPKFRFAFKENEIRLNQLFLGFDGYFAMPGNDMEMDIKFKAAKTEFKNIISLLPAVYTKDFEQAEASGKLALDGFVKGIYNEKKIPAFALNLLIENGMLKYPGLPTAINHMNMQLNVKNPDGEMDHTDIDLSRFHVELGAEPFDASLKLSKPMSSRQLEAILKGKVNLGNVARLLPMEEGMKIGGEIKADFTAKGSLAALEKQQYEQFYAGGNIQASQLQFSSKDMKQDFMLKGAALSFNPRNVKLSGLDAKIGHTDIQAEGSLDNLLGYVLGGKTLKGNLQIRSNLIDANEFLSEEETKTTAPAAADTVPLQAFEIPANLDFTLDARIGRLLYDNLEMKNLKGLCELKDQKLIMRDMGMDIFNGSVLMDGAYDSKNIKQPAMDMKFGLKNIDIQKLVNSFESIQQMAPMAKNTEGNVTADFNMDCRLNNDLSPIMNSINAAGMLDLPKAVIKDYKPLVKVAELLKMPQYKQLAVNNVKVNFEVKNGRVFVKPFEVKAGNINMNIVGSSGFDKSLDYTVKTAFPRSEMGAAANQVLSGLSSKINAAGLNLQPSDIINMDILMGGTVPEPIIKTTLKDLGKSAVQSVKQELDKKKQELENKARDEAAKAKAEAEAKAKAEADRLKAEAEEKVKKELEAQKEAQKKKAAEEVKKKLKGIKF